MTFVDFCHGRHAFFLYPVSLQMAEGLTCWQALCLQAGLENQLAVLHLADHQLLNEHMLEDVSTLLNGCNMPVLLEAPDLTCIMSALQETLSASGLQASKVSLLQHQQMHG